MSIKRLNVQEQNAITKDNILSEAKYWRENGIPLALHKILLEKEINPKTTLFLDYEQDFHGMNTDEGIIVTAEKKFISFSMDLNKDKTELMFLEVGRYHREI
ncbi:hypothetical protein ACE193_05650 [Bernardetia sp. OM2101]|uniref:hypothetical protein n=1 Tax=Bernardetia sp. OM2101 TaxID=3344876 RepID=UPI0035D0E839